MLTEKPKMGSVCVVIPTHDSSKTIVRALRSVKNQGCDVIVVDDGSKDNTVFLAEKEGVKVLKIQKCTPAKARNFGVSKTKGTIVAFLDSDCIAGENWIQVIKREMKENKAIGGSIENAEKESLVAWAEYFLEFCGFDSKRKKETVSSVPSCNAAYRKKEFLKAGGFPDIRACEDVLFGEKLSKMNVKTIFVPEMEIQHINRTEFRKVMENSRLLGEYFIRRARRFDSSSNSFWGKSRLVLPALFLAKLFARTAHAVKSGKILLFVATLPIIICGVIEFCKGAWRGFDENR